MMLSTPYSLPFTVQYQPELARRTHDVSVRIVTSLPPSPDTAQALNATLLPFLLLLSSGALAGESIPPWTSTVDSWTTPQIHAASIDWHLTSVTCDLRAWVVLAQMLLVDHPRHSFTRLEIAVAQTPDPFEWADVLQGDSRINPYPRPWAGIDFSVDLGDDIDKDFTVCVSFVRPLSEAEQMRVSDEFFDWAPGLINGAYGVAPVPPDSCTGLPDPDIVFVDNELEWIIRHCKAHTGALEGLINVVAAISHQVVQVTEFRIE